MSENMGEDGQRMMEQMRGHMTDFMQNANDWLGELGEAGQKQIMEQLTAHPELMDTIVEQNPGKYTVYILGWSKLIEVNRG